MPNLYALALLMIVGTAIGSIFPLSFAAAERGVPTSAYGFWYAFGAAVIVYAVKMLWQPGSLCWRRYGLFYAIAGLISMTYPYGMTIFVVPRIGVGLPAMFFAMVPLLTSAWAWLLGVGEMSGRNVAALIIGFIGASIIVASRYVLDADGSGIWILLALTIPVCLAFGNVYRTWKWPPNGTPLQLSAGLLFLAAAWFFPLMVMDSGIYLPNPAARPGDWFLVAQVLIGAILFLVYFELQQVGGPVYLGQIGYVATGTGLFAGVVFFGERYDAVTWVGVALVLLGLLLSRPQRILTATAPVAAAQAGSSGRAGGAG